MMAKIVKPRDFSGFNFSPMMIFGIGPKFAITCGNCFLSFEKRIPLVDNPGLCCPHCDCINVMPLGVGRLFEEETLECNRKLTGKQRQEIMETFEKRHKGPMPC